MIVNLSGPTGRISAELISAEGKFITVCLGATYLRFRRETGAPAGAPTQTANPYRLEAAELRRLP